MIYKSKLFDEIEVEFSKVTAKDYTTAANPINNLKTSIFYIKKHHFPTQEDFEKAAVKAIADTIKILEKDIISKALAFQELAYKDYKQLVDPQKWINFSQKEASKISYEEYSDDEIKFLRHLYILWLTWVYCDEELKKLRIKSSKEQYQNLGKSQREYITKRNDILKQRVQSWHITDDE
ncbi:hypothetical protein [Spiroplasma alleghenense]|uniref:Uncharacterized protein n=1 Tax=Spiroplasma alleghenense TaxID=216931 RepID=A0A345Z3S7_9MOLU|nr:hypothetical protein [Spiroplasma alleghenense]AXK51256.1 hypothetical protein SALLE_v1c05840 [Spiroplasma alleghenense]